MIYHILGTLAFVLFFIYDWNSITWKNKLIHSFFGVGFLLLLISTGGMLLFLMPKIDFDLYSLVIFGGLSLISLLLLIYTLFFALPFGDTYLGESGLPRACTTGMYALCRHPGVLWFFFLYLFLSLAIKEPEMYLLCIILNFWNLMYIIFQDRVTFMKTFENYEDYKKETPFLIPTKLSIMNCFQTFSGKGLQE